MGCAAQSSVRFPADSFNRFLFDQDERMLWLRGGAVTAAGGGVANPLRETMSQQDKFSLSTGESLNNPTSGQETFCGYS